MKPIKAEDVVAIREALSLSRSEFGSLFYVTEESVNLWESSDEFAGSISGIHRELLLRLRLQMGLSQSVSEDEEALFVSISREIIYQIKNTPNLCIPIVTLLRRLQLGV